MKYGWTLLVSVLTVTALSAQSLPRGVAFNVSPDHNSDLVSGYKIYLLSSGRALRTRDAGKPRPDGNGQITHLDAALFSGLSNGAYEIAVTAYGPGGESGLSSKTPFTVGSTSSVPSPPSNPEPIYEGPTTNGLFVQAEHFNDGGQNRAYRDNTEGNLGGVFRDTDVDIEETSDEGEGYNVGWVHAGEWLNYTVNVPASATYTLEVRVASLGPGGTFHIEVDGVNVTGPLRIPNTGGWQVWTTVRKAGVPLRSGTQTWRLVIDREDPSNPFAGNINWLRAVR